MSVIYFEGFSARKQYGPDNHVQMLFLFIYTLSKICEGEYHLVNIFFASSLALVGA
jgi:hypothetical protein